MDLVLKGRGIRITDQLRKTAEHKTAKLSRQDSRIVRLELKFLEEGSPRVDGGYRVEAACDVPRHTFRAEATGKDLDSAIDQVVDHLERQISDRKGKRRYRWLGRGNRLQSGLTSPDEAATSE